MAQDKDSETPDAGEPAEISEVEQQEIAQLHLCRSKLSPEQAARLRKAFPGIVNDHREQVRNLLRKRNLNDDVVDDLEQEVFLLLLNHILEHGFPKNIPGMLNDFVDGKVRNHRRGENRSPFSAGLPTSSAEKPRSSAPDLDAILHRRELARRLVSRLSPEHRVVLNEVYVKGLSHSEAAEVLGLPLGTVKSRVVAATEALDALSKRLVPPSQRGPL